MNKKTPIIICISIIISVAILSGCSILDSMLSPDSTPTPLVNFDQGTQEVADPPKGYSITIPDDMMIDSSLAESYTKAISDDTEIFISREISVYKDVIYYIDNYFDRYITSPTYQEKNNINLNYHSIDNINGKRVKILSVTRTPYESSEVKLNTYTYAYILHDDAENSFHRIMIKSTDFNLESIVTLLESFKNIPIVGEPKNTIDTTLTLPNWNDETRQYYDAFYNRENVMWGIFVPELESPTGFKNSIPQLESQLEYNFELCMQYFHIPHELPPTTALEESYAVGKTTVLTMQISTMWNNDLETNVNPNFEVIDGKRDNELREYAKVVKEFGHPVFLRINNEMNTDWTSYSGVQTLGDPEIFKAVYSRIYNIFAEEGVDNGIWIFNPQYGDSPPANFNNYMSYFPGSNMVQVLGVTLYNSGTYYQDNGEGIWNTFGDLYDGVNELYSEKFSSWPWMIGEFGCASYGGIKENWITNMFNKIGDYKNIKGAIWLNWEAYDARKGSFGTVSRCYRLDETPASLNAFKDGLHGTQTRKILNEHE